MANHKSAIKRYRQSKKRNARNSAQKSEISTYIKRVLAAGKDDANALFKTLQSKLDKAGRKGLIKRKKVARTLSKLSKAVSAKA